MRDQAHLAAEQGPDRRPGHGKALLPEPEDIRPIGRGGRKGGPKLEALIAGGVPAIATITDNHPSQAGALEPAIRARMRGADRGQQPGLRLEEWAGQMELEALVVEDFDSVE